MPRIVIFILLFVQLAPRPVQAALIPEWMGHRMYLMARVGEDFISNYDLHVDVLVTRALDRRMSVRAPYPQELKRSAAQLLNRNVIIGTTRSLSNVVPEPAEIQRIYQTVLAAYGGTVTAFETQTGLTEARLQYEADQRAIMESYLRALYERTVRGNAEFSSRLTQASSQGMLQPMLDEFGRIRARYLERSPLEVLDGPLKRGDFLQDVLPFASN